MSDARKEEDIVVIIRQTCDSKIKVSKTKLIRVNKHIKLMMRNTDKTKTEINSNEVRVMVFNATFNIISAISWRSVLLVKGTGENHRPAAIH